MTHEHPNLRRPTSASGKAHPPADSPLHSPGTFDRSGQSHPFQESVAKQPSTNLILPRSPLIGRDHEVAAIQHLLLQNGIGLLTLTGTGGIGKTRLAMQVAANLLDHFVDGVYFVSLAPIREAELVGVTIAQTLGVREVGGQPLLESLQDYIQDRLMLLVLDNFEQVAAAAPLVGKLLSDCQRLKVLVTSRAPLQLYGEQEFPAPPLALPDAKRLSTIGDTELSSLNNVAAIALFVQRVRAVKPDFALTTTNAAAVAAICISLDGLPLAIELAAVKLRLFAPLALLARLRQRLVLLTDGAQDLPIRQQTLRANVAWSYELLAQDEQTLFRRLAVFASGFTLESAQAVSKVVSGDPLPDLEQAQSVAVLNGVTALVNQNLLKQIELVGNEPRFGMLETIREYGLAQLAASDEADVIHRQHAEYFLAFAEALEPALLGAERPLILARLETELDNLRAAIAWSQTALGSAEVGLRLAGALAWFAHFANHDGEARNWLMLALQRSSAPTAARAKALWGVGLIVMPQGDAQIATTMLEESVALWRGLGTPYGLAAGLRELGFALFAQGDAIAAQRYCEESVSLWREVGSQWDLALSLFVLGCVNLHGDQSTALELFEESRSLFRDARDGWGSAITLIGQGYINGKRGDYATARAHLTEAVTGWQDQQDKVSKIDALCLLGEVMQRQGESHQASSVYVECLLLSREIGDKARCAFILRHLGSVTLSLSQYARATQLFAAAAALSDKARIVRLTSLDTPGEQANELATLRAQLGEESFTTNWATGEAMTLDEAIEFAVASDAPTPPLSEHSLVTSPTTATNPAGLTAREVEVLRLLAQGLTYAQIAEQLVISQRTVNGHVTSIYGKLEVTSRALATRYAIDHHLI